MAAPCYLGWDFSTQQVPRHLPRPSPAVPSLGRAVGPGPPRFLGALPAAGLRCPGRLRGAGNGGCPGGMRGMSSALPRPPRTIGARPSFCRQLPSPPRAFRARSPPPEAGLPCGAARPARARPGLRERGGAPCPGSHGWCQIIHGITQSLGLDCPGRLWSLPRWRWLVDVCTESCAVCLEMSLIKQGDWTG